VGLQQVENGLWHIDHGLLHGLEHLSMHGQNLFKCRWGWCVSSIVVPTIVVVVGGVAAPGVDHLTNMFDEISKKEVVVGSSMK
jgi:hypothetical protein